MDSAGRPQTVTLKSPYGRNDEKRAAGAITPGHLISHNVDDEVVVHPTAGGAGERTYATEDIHLLEGKTIDDAFAADDLVSFRYYLPGDEVFAWLKDGEVVVINDDLSSNGDGTLQKAAGVEVVVAKAAEALDLSGVGNTTAQRLKIRVL